MDLLRIKKSLFMSGIAWQHYRVIRKLSLSRICCTQNHYEVLGLSKLCTQEDIKRAFFEKSKQLHPDKNAGTPQTHRLFVDVNEAYSVLSKHQTRAVYDNYLARQRTSHFIVFQTNLQKERVVFRDDSLWENRDRSRDKYYEEKPYYGIKGVERLPNKYIAGGVVLLMILGAFFHYYIAKIFNSYASCRLERKDFIVKQNYMMAKENAKANGTSKQLSLLLHDWRGRGTELKTNED